MSFAVWVENFLREDKIQSIIIRFLSPAPRLKTITRSAIESFARFIVFTHSHFCSVVLVGDEESIGRSDDKDHHEWHFVESAPSNAQQ